MKKTATLANAAKAIKKELIRKHADVIFSVRPESFAGDIGILIEWTNGPSEKEVEKILGKYSLKYVKTNRKIDDNVLGEVFKWLRDTHSWFDMVSCYDEKSQTLEKYWGVSSARDYMHRLLRDENLVGGYRHLQKLKA